MSTIKHLLLAGAVAIAPLPALAAPTEATIAEAVTDEEAYDPMGEDALAQTKAKMQREMDEVIALIEKIFDTGSLPPVEPAQLALAQQTTAALIPPGSLEKMIDNMYGKFFSAFMGELGGTSDMMLGIKTGVESDKIAALDDKSKEAIADMFDPHRKQREDQMIQIIRPLISEALSDIEAPMREGLAKAYARKFTAAQLNDMNGFFATPSGKLFANESMALQADPEVMVAMVRAMPPMIGKFIDRAPEIESQFKGVEQLPKERELADFSEADLKKLAKLMKVDVKTLKENRDMWATAATDDATYAGCGYDADPDSAEGAACAAAEAAADAVADAAGHDDPAWNPENWAETDREKVDELNAAAAAANAAAFEAEAEAAANARKKLGLPDPAE